MALALLVGGLIVVIAALFLTGQLLLHLMRGKITLGADRLRIRGSTWATLSYHRITSVQRVAHASADAFFGWNRPNVKIMTRGIFFLLIPGPPFILPTNSVVVTINEDRTDAFLRDVAARQ